MCFLYNQTEVPKDLGHTLEAIQIQLSPLGMLWVLNFTWRCWSWRCPPLPPASTSSHPDSLSAVSSDREAPADSGSRAEWQVCKERCEATVQRVHGWEEALGRSAKNTFFFFFYFINISRVSSIPIAVNREIGSTNRSYITGQEQKEQMSPRSRT